MYLLVFIVFTKYVPITNEQAEVCSDGIVLWLNMIIAFQIILPPGLICINFKFTCETGKVTVNEV